MIEAKIRLAVFGGTFDPPHRGHFHVACQVLAGGYAGEVVFVPNRVPPHKQRLPAGGFEDRVRMLEIGICPLVPGMSVSDIEGRRGAGNPSYTFDTMEELSRMRPDRELLLLIGADSLLSLHTWHRAEELAGRWGILAYPRKGCADLSKLHDFWPEPIANRLEKTILPMDTVDVSSSMIREMLGRGEEAGGLVSPGVVEYIKQRGLYLNADQEEQ